MKENFICSHMFYSPYHFCNNQISSMLEQAKKISPTPENFYTNAFFLYDRPFPTALPAILILLTMCVETARFLRNTSNALHQPCI